jgi:hypothetical protein
MTTPQTQAAKPVRKMNAQSKLDKWKVAALEEGSVFVPADRHGYWVFMDSTGQAFPVASKDLYDLKEWDDVKALAYTKEAIAE